MEKQLPQSVLAEKGVLGSIVIDPGAIVHVMDTLRAEHFYRDAHRTIYQAILSIYKRQESPDFITLCDELERDNKLEQIGGPGYVTSLINEVPTSGNIEYYARIVKEKHTFRSLIEQAGKIAAAAYAEDENALPDAEHALYSLAQGVETTPIVNHVEAIDAYMTTLNELHEQNKKGVLTGIPTGYRLLNHLYGGFRKSKMYVLAARPGEGKTALALNFALHAVKSGCNVLFFSLEMDKEELMQRALAWESGVDSMHLRDAALTDDMDDEGQTEWDRVVNAHIRILEYTGKLFIDDTPANNNIAMRARALRMQAEHGIDMIIVDYLQLATAVMENNKRGDRRLEVEEVSRSLKNLARELKVPVLALAQLNREVESRASHVPQLSDLREAGGIEQDCDAAMFIYKDPTISKDAIDYDVSLMLLKHRNGKKGVVPLHYVGSQTRFYAKEG